MGVRVAEAGDLTGLAEIERSADGLFAPLGIVFPPGPTVIEEAIRDGAEILVVGEPPYGFAATSELNGATYLEQIALRADHVGRGLGGALLDAVIERAPGAVTLITFRDVPWNGPWYARYGFTELPPDLWTTGLSDHWHAEIAAGLHDLAPRLIMSRPPS